MGRYLHLLPSFGMKGQGPATRKETATVLKSRSPTVGKIEAVRTTHGWSRSMCAPYRRKGRRKYPDRKRVRSLRRLVESKDRKPEQRAIADGGALRPAYLRGAIHPARDRIRFNVPQPFKPAPRRDNRIRRWTYDGNRREVKPAAIRVTLRVEIEIRAMG